MKSKTKTKKSISSIVAIGLLLIVSVLAVTGFQSWYSSYQSSTLSKVEKDTQVDSIISVQALVGNELYIESNGDIELELFKIVDDNGIDKCNFVFKNDDSLEIGLVGFWKLDGNFIDSSSSGIHGSCSVPNCPTLISKGIKNQAYKVGYDGISLGDNYDLGLSDWTYSFWIKLLSMENNGGYMLHKGAGNGFNGSRTDVRNDLVGKIRFFFGSQSVYMHSTSSTSISDGNWHHVLISINRSGNLITYVDMIKGSSADISSEKNVNIGTTTNMRIGLTYSSANFSGIMDEVKIWDRTLSESEIKLDYHSSLLDYSNNILEINVDKCNLTKDEVYNIVAFSSTNKIDQKIIAK